MATAAVVPVDNNPVVAEKLPKPWVPVHYVPPSRDTSQNSTVYLPSLSGQYQLHPATFASHPGATRTNSSSSGERKSGPSVREERKQSRTSLYSESRRSVSSPHVGGEIANEAVTITSPADKRKNKLGYQRTSMACGHCRKRKIRCIPPADEDPDAATPGRCANCIRLKKDCNFFPVEHATDTSSGRRDIGSISASSASSPRTPVPPGPSSLPLIEPQRLSQFEQTGGSESTLSLPGNAGFPSPYLHGPVSAKPSPLPYPANFQGSRSEENPEWSPPEFGPSTHLPPPYWASPESTPNRPNFSPNPVSGMGASPNPQFSSPPIGYHQGNQAWPPSRSSSFGHIEGMTSNYPYSEVAPGSEIRHNMEYPMASQSASASHTNLADSSVHSDQILASVGQVVPNNVHFQQPWVQPGQHVGDTWFVGPSGTNLEGGDPMGDQYQNLSHNFYPHATSAG